MPEKAVNVEVAGESKVRVSFDGGRLYEAWFVPLDAYLDVYPSGLIDRIDQEIPGARWRVELHHDDCNDWQFADWPNAMAWVYIYRFRYGDEVEDGAAELRFIEVPEHLRRQGYGTLLWAAILKRWPEINLSEPIEPEMQALVDAFEARTGANRETAVQSQETKRRDNRARGRHERRLDRGADGAPDRQDVDGDGRADPQPRTGLQVAGVRPPGVAANLSGGIVE